MLSYYRVKFHGAHTDIISYLRNKMKSKEIELLSEIRHDFILLSCDSKESENIYRFSNTEINSRESILSVFNFSYLNNI